MKKLISMLLALVMVLGLSVAGFAATEISEGGWRGNAVITDSYPGSGDRGDVVKVNGTAILTPNVNAIANTPIIEMTADIYGTGTVALVNGVGTAAATVTVAAETAGYKAGDWNTVKLYAVTGQKTYKAYVNDTEVVSDGTVAQTTTPVKISFTGEDLYVDNITLKEYRKNGAYGDGFINLYTASKNLSHSKYSNEMDGADGKWSVQGWNYNTPGDASSNLKDGHNIRIFPDSSFDTSKDGVIKYTKDNDEKVQANPLTYADATAPGTIVYSMEIRPQSTAGSELQITLSDAADTYFRNGVGGLAFYDGGITLSNGYTLANAYEDGQWYTLKIEINAETQSQDIYWSRTGETLKKINAYPLTLQKPDTDGFKALGKLRFNINYTLAACTYYIANFKVEKPIDGLVTETVFEENFDSSTNKLVYNANGYEEGNRYLNLASGVSKDGKTVGKLEFMAHSNSDFSGVSENVAADTKATDADLIETYPKISSRGNVNEYYSIKDFNNLSDDNVVALKVSYGYYNAAVARKVSTNTKADTLWVEMVDNDAASPQIFRQEIHQAKTNGYSAFAINGGTMSSGDDAAPYKSWKTGEGHIADYDEKYRTLIYSTGGEGNAKVSAGRAAYRHIPDITSSVLKNVDEIRIYIDSQYGGAYYLDNFKVEATVDYGEGLDVVEKYYTAETFYTNEIEAEEAPNGLNVSDVAINNGKVDSVTLSKKDFAIPEGAKMFVAVYNGEVLLDCGVTEVAEGDFADGSKTYPFSGIDYTRDSVIKVFILNGTTLVPLYTMDAPKTVFIVGDSLVQDYVGLSYENGQSGWGEQEKIGAYLNLGQVVIKDYAIGGTSSKDFFDRLQTTVDGERFNIPNRDFWAQVKKGDYIFICTGTNDSKIEQPARYADPYGSADEEGSYLNNIVKNYIEPAEAIGAIPVLVTTGAILGSKNSVSGRYRCTDGGYARSIEAYGQALRAFAEEEGYAIVDLWALWTDMLSSMSTEDAKAAYYVSSDNTHTNSAGAAKAAEFIAICLEQIYGIRDIVK